MLSSITNHVSTVVVRALAIIFVLAVGAFAADILGSDLGDLIGRVAFWAAVAIALVWGIADGRVSADLTRILLVWLAVGVLVALGAGFILKTVAEGGGEEVLSWFDHAWTPALIALLPGAAGAALGFFIRDHLPERLRPHHTADF